MKIRGYYMYHLKWCLISLKMRVSLMSYDKMINDQGGQIRILCQGMEILTRETSIARSN
jgi:ribosome biogenesis protein Nip4